MVDKCLPPRLALDHRPPLLLCHLLLRDLQTLLLGGSSVIVVSDDLLLSMLFLLLVSFLFLLQSCRQRHPVIWSLFWLLLFLSTLLSTFNIISISICLLLVGVFVAHGFVVVGTVVIILFSFFCSWFYFILSGLLLSICFAWIWLSQQRPPFINLWGTSFQLSLLQQDFC